MIGELYMIELAVADWPASVAWYRDRLGLVVELIDEPGRFALFRAGETRVALKAGAAESGGVRLVFRIPDLEAELSRLAAFGVVPDGPIKISPEGYRRAVIRDLDGYALELFEWVT